MTKPELEARRDSSAIECVTDYRGDKDQYAEVGLECYKHGWDSCAALLQGEMDKYSESMRFYMSELQSANAKLAVAKTALNKINKTTYGSELSMSDEEWRDYFSKRWGDGQSTAREALSQIAAMDASEGKGEGIDD